MKLISKTTMVISTLLILLPIGIGIYLWSELPQSMAIHFNLNNEPNGYTNKIIAVIGIPIFLCLMHWIVIHSIAKDKENQNEKISTVLVWIAPIVSIACAIAFYSYNTNIAIDLSRIFKLILGLILIITGNYLPKCRMNSTVGLKTPWTLRSELVWNKTHQVFAVIWVFCGFILTIGGLVKTTMNSWFLLILLFICIVCPYFYSWYLSKK